MTVSYYYTQGGFKFFMDILAVDYTKKDLDHLTQIIKESKPEAKIEGVQTFDEALSLAKEKLFDLAFITPDHDDIEKTTELVRALKEKYRDTHIIVTSKTKKYMSDAFSVHADAYLIKPVALEEMNAEMDYMMKQYPAPLRNIELVARTFGGFNVYHRGKKIKFKRNKSKDLLAILIDNRGVGLTTREVCSMLFNGRKYDEITLGYYHVVLTSLNSTLKEVGINNLIRKSVNYISINPDMVDCDMYRYLRGDVDAIKDYHGDYMMNYKWAERVKSAVAEDEDGEIDD